MFSSRILSDFPAPFTMSMSFIRIFVYLTNAAAKTTRIKTIVVLRNGPVHFKCPNTEKSHSKETTQHCPLQSVNANSQEYTILICMGQREKTASVVVRKQCGRWNKINWTKTPHRSHWYTLTLCWYTCSCVVQSILFLNWPSEGLNSWWLSNQSLPMDNNKAPTSATECSRSDGPRIWNYLPTDVR